MEQESLPPTPSQAGVGGKVEPQTSLGSEFSKKHLSCYVSNYALGLLGELQP